MEQLTFKDLKEFVVNNHGDIPDDTLIYLGNDDEMNGAHCGWYIETINLAKVEDREYFDEMVESYNRPKTTNKMRIIIS